MAVTKFKDLHRFVRTFLNDLDDHFKLFSNFQIDNYISTFSGITGSPIQNGRKMEFTTEITSIQDQVLLAAKVALMVLEQADTYSFTTRIYSAGNSSQDVKRRIQALQLRIEEIESGESSGVAVVTDGDWRAFFGIEAKQRTINLLEEDSRASTQSPPSS